MEEVRQEEETLTTEQLPQEKEVVVNFKKLALWSVFMFIGVVFAGIGLALSELLAEAILGAVISWATGLGIIALR